jgi:hypothetical protein
VCSSGYSERDRVTPAQKERAVVLQSDEMADKERAVSNLSTEIEGRDELIHNLG